MIKVIPPTTKGFRYVDCSIESYSILSYMETARERIFKEFQINKYREFRATCLQGLIR